jgi:hydrogenase maturation factor
LLNSKGKEIFSVELESKIECIDYDGITLCVVDSDHVVSTFNKRGKLIGKSKLDSPAQDIAVSGKYCYALCFGTVIQLDIRTNLD